MIPLPQLAKDLFLKALELPPRQRSGFVSWACREDAELSARVRALLAAHAQADVVVEGGLPAGLSRDLRQGVRNVARKLGLETG